jgi:hypothetical protein
MRKGIACVAVLTCMFVVVPHLWAQATNPIDNLSYSEKTRFREILSATLAGPDYPSPAVRAEFWRLLDKVGRMSDGDIATLRETMTGIPVEYMRSFYEDALWAVKSGRPFKSGKTEELETRYLKRKLITEWRVRENEDMIRKIALRQPISTQGTTVLLDEARIQSILDGLSSSSKRVEVLFERLAPRR